MIDELDTLKNQYNERDNEVIRLTELLERAQTDKTKLSRRVSKLVLNGNYNHLLFLRSNQFFFLTF